MHRELRELKEFFQAYALTKQIAFITHLQKVALKMNIWRGIVMYSVLSLRSGPPVWGMMTWGYLTRTGELGVGELQMGHSKTRKNVGL